MTPTRSRGGRTILPTLSSGGFELCSKVFTRVLKTFSDFLSFVSNTFLINIRTPFQILNVGYVFIRNRLSDGNVPGICQDFGFLPRKRLRFSEDKSLRFTPVFAFRSSRYSRWPPARCHRMSPSSHGWRSGPIPERLDLDIESRADCV